MLWVFQGGAAAPAVGSAGVPEQDSAESPPRKKPCLDDWVKVMSCLYHCVEPKAPARKYAHLDSNAAQSSEM